MASASVPRMGPEVITGEHTRMRLRADAMDRDIECTSFRARPGQKYTRSPVPSASCTQPWFTRPDVATTGCCQSCSKSCVYALARSGEATVKMTFSSRVHESLVQLVDPLSTAAPSRTTYL